MPDAEEQTTVAEEEAHTNPYSVIAESTFHAPPPVHEEITARIASDPRMHGHVEGFLSCLQCGICTSGCPAARFGDYSPREIVRRALDGDPTLLSDDSVWLCFYCYTCQSRCPRGNSVAVINQIIRGLQVEQGYGIRHVKMFTAWAEQFYDKGIGGTPQVFFRDRVEALGPKWRRFIERRDELRAELGLGSMFPSEKAAAEMRTIMDETGFRDRLLSMGAWGGDRGHRP
ncbi:MAG: 4Fe-4S dicluster domain-containing protein [Acidimicrobiales bacterium]